MRFLEHRIADRRLLHLIRKWLKAGILEDGRVTVPEEGTPQGSVISPLLANVYLHYVLDLWAYQWRRRHARGEIIVGRYADDIVFGFQYRDDDKRSRAALEARLKRFALSLHPDKTRLIEFGRSAASSREKRGLGKPETFTFLGFTHICAKTRNGKSQHTPENATQADEGQAQGYQGRPVRATACTGRGATAGGWAKRCTAISPTTRFLPMPRPSPLFGATSQGSGGMPSGEAVRTTVPSGRSSGGWRSAGCPRRESDIPGPMTASTPHTRDRSPVR